MKLLYTLLFYTCINSCLFAQNRPNIVFILADDLGYGDLASYGHPHIQSPNIDQLVNEGLKLTHFYSASPLCSPSRAGFLTGRTPFRTGIKSWIPEGQGIYLHEQELTLATLLKQYGYQNFMAGKWHLNGGLGDEKHPQPQDHGFDNWMVNHAFALPTHKDPHNFYRNGKPLGEIKGFSAQIVADECINWLENRSPDQPFFLYIPFNEPHSEIASPEEFNTQYAEFTNGKITLDSLYDRGPGEYYANITHLDYQIGRVLKKLDELNVCENTLVIFTSDNGPVTSEWRHWWEVNMYGSTGGLRGRKADLFEGGIRVPCVIRYPKMIKAGSVSDLPLHAYDIFPTICALVGIDEPQDRIIDGEDFSTMLKGEKIDREKPLFWAFETRESNDPSGYDFALRDGNWKLITNYTFDKHLLFDLYNDPYESNDVSKKYPKKTATLIRRTEEMYGSILMDKLRP